MGEGEYGKIYLTQSMKDNQYYAMKIETFKNRGEAHKSQKITKMVKDFLKNTNSEGICKIYGDIWLKKNNLYNYYVLMEKAELDMVRGCFIYDQKYKGTEYKETVNKFYNILRKNYQIKIIKI